jgi:hypothetical protein
MNILDVVVPPLNVAIQLQESTATNIRLSALQPNNWFHIPKLHLITVLCRFPTISPGPEYFLAPVCRYGLVIKKVPARANNSM